MKLPIGTLTLLSCLVSSFAFTDSEIEIKKLVRVDKPKRIGNGDVCRIMDRPRSLTFEYRPADYISNLQSGNAKFEFQNPVDDSCSAFAMMGEEDDPKKMVEEMVKFESNDISALNKVFAFKQVSCGETFEGKKKGGTDDFPASTYLFFFKSKPTLLNWSTLLVQQVKFKGDCSKPLNFGDQFGSGKLTCYRGKGDAAATEYCTPKAEPAQPSLFDEDTHDGPGPQANAGDTVVFTSVVVNRGPDLLCDVEIDSSANVGVQDYPIYVAGDDGDGCLAPNADEKWIYVQSQLVDHTDYELPVTFTDTVTAVNSEGLQVTDSYDSKYIRTAAFPSTPFGFCDICDKPTSMIWTYDPSTALYAMGNKALLSGSKPADSVFLVVADKTDVAKLKGSNPDANIYFRGTLNAGDVFETKTNFLELPSGQRTDRFENEAFFQVFASEDAFNNGQLPVQMGTLDASCSTPLIPGLTLGSFYLESTYRGKEDCRFPVSMDVVLVNAATDNDVETLDEGDTLILQSIGSSLSLRAEALGAKKFVYSWTGMDGSAETVSVQDPPYAMDTNKNGDFKPIPYLGVPGLKSVTVTAKSVKDFPLKEVTVSFSVVDQTDAPTAAPTVENIRAVGRTKGVVSGNCNDPDEIQQIEEIIDRCLVDTSLGVIFVEPKDARRRDLKDDDNDQKDGSEFEFMEGVEVYHDGHVQRMLGTCPVNNVVICFTLCGSKCVRRLSDNVTTLNVMKVAERNDLENKCNHQILSEFIPRTPECSASWPQFQLDMV